MYINKTYRIYSVCITRYWYFCLDTVCIWWGRQKWTQKGNLLLPWLTIVASGEEANLGFYTAVLPQRFQKGLLSRWQRSKLWLPTNTKHFEPWLYSVFHEVHFHSVGVCFLLREKQGGINYLQPKMKTAHRLTFTSLHLKTNCLYLDRVSGL